MFAAPMEVFDICEHDGAWGERAREFQRVAKSLWRCLKDPTKSYKFLEDLKRRKRVLGKGGSGTVYLTEYEGVQLAVKCMALDEGDTLKAFEQERVMSSVFSSILVGEKMFASPHVLGCHGALFEEDTENGGGHYYIIMEKWGRELYSEFATYSFWERRRVIAQLLMTLIPMWHYGLSHGDAFFTNVLTVAHELTYDVSYKLDEVYLNVTRCEHTVALADYGCAHVYSKKHPVGDPTEVWMHNFHSCAVEHHVWDPSKVHWLDSCTAVQCGHKHGYHPLLAKPGTLHPKCIDFLCILQAVHRCESHATQPDPTLTEWAVQTGDRLLKLGYDPSISVLKNLIKSSLSELIVTAPEEGAHMRLEKGPLVAADYIVGE
jgi:hypothetical protein